MTELNDRKSVESFIGLKMAEIAEALTAARSDDAMFPTGLPATLERSLSFATVAASVLLAEFKPRTAKQICTAIDQERDRRIDSGFTFGAHTFQSRASDRENVMGAAQLAMAYLGAGGDPSSLRWANPDADFVWIAADNQTVPLSAPDVVALLQTGVAFKSVLTFYARAMKDAVIAADDPSSVEWREGWPM